MSIITATIAIEGTRPLLFHHFSPETLPLEKQERTGVAGNDPTEWQRTVLLTPDRQLCLPGTYFFGCLRNAAVYLKRGRNTMQKAVASTLQVTDATVLIEGCFLPEEPLLVQQGQLVENLPPVYIDVCGVRNPNTKSRNVRYRVAAAPGWQCTFHLLWDITVVSREEMKSICIDAGRLVGLADGRTIGFGRFEVKSYDCANTS